MLRIREPYPKLPKAKTMSTLNEGQTKAHFPSWVEARLHESVIVLVFPTGLLNELSLSQGKTTMRRSALVSFKNKPVPQKAACFLSLLYCSPLDQCCSDSLGTVVRCTPGSLSESPTHSRPPSVCFQISPKGLSPADALLLLWRLLILSIFNF